MLSPSKDDTTLLYQRGRYKTNLALAIVNSRIQSILKEKKYENSVIIYSPRLEWKDRWSFVVDKTFLELRSKTEVQHSPLRVDGEHKNQQQLQLNMKWLHTAHLGVIQVSETLKSKIDLKRCYS